MLTELINYHRKSPKTVNLLNHGNIYNLKKKKTLEPETV